MFTFSICTSIAPIFFQFIFPIKEKFQVSTKTEKLNNVTSKTNSKDISIMYAIILKWILAHNSFSIPEIIFSLIFRRKKKKKHGIVRNRVICFSELP